MLPPSSSAFEPLKHARRCQSPQPQQTQQALSKNAKVLLRRDKAEDRCSRKTVHENKTTLVLATHSAGALWSRVWRDGSPFGACQDAAQTVMPSTRGPDWRCGVRRAAAAGPRRKASISCDQRPQLLWQGTRAAVGAPTQALDRLFSCVCVLPANTTPSLRAAGAWQFCLRPGMLVWSLLLADDVLAITSHAKSVNVRLRFEPSTSLISVTLLRAEQLTIRGLLTWKVRDRYVEDGDKYRCRTGTIRCVGPFLS